MVASRLGRTPLLSRTRTGEYSPQLLASRYAEPKRLNPRHVGRMDNQDWVRYQVSGVIGGIQAPQRLCNPAQMCRWTPMGSCAISPRSTRSLLSNAGPEICMNYASAVS